MLAALLVAWAPAARAAPGQTAFDFLNLGVGARQAAMGQAGAGAADGLEGAYVNPAGLARLWQQEASFLYVSHVQDISYQSLGYARPTLDYGSFGVGLFNLDYGAIQGYDNTGAKTGSVFAGDRMLTLDYAKTVRSGLSAGAGFHYINEKLGGDGAQALALDLGVQDRPWAQGPLANLELGLSVRDIGPSARFVQRKEALPLTVQGGAAYKAFQDTLLFAMDLVKPAQESIGARLGAEFWVNPSVAFRAGYNTQYDIGQGFSLGLGLRFKDFVVDYAFVPYSDLGNSNRVGLTYRFGSQAQTYYERGLHKMREGNFAEAIMEFDKALAIDPHHETTLLRMREAHELLLKKLGERQ